ncbi:MAG: hypothetical protein PHD05_04395, partial [Sphaerochaetaceae bacterium]|nr:hypothetical protein [Sphaerochaetaceae bacterium]
APLLETNSTKSLIIKILSENQSLSLKELHAKLQKQKQLSYQATHKAVSEMVNENILEKIGRELQIDKDWIEHINKFTQDLKTPNENSNPNNTGTSQTYSFENFVEYARFVIRFFLEAPNINNKEGVCILNHSWPLFGMSNTDYDLLKKLFSETKFYEIVKNATPLDIAFSKTVEQIGKKVRLPEKYDSSCDIVVKGDQIFQAFYTPEFSKTFDALYNKHTTMNEEVMNELITKIMSPKTKIVVNIFKDKELAETIRQDVLRRYKK